MAARNRMGHGRCEMTFQAVTESLSERGYTTTAKVAWHLERQGLLKFPADPAIRWSAEERGLLREADGTATACCGG
jgi:hypothetical protein